MVFPPGLDLGCTFLAGVAQRWCLCSSASCQEAHVSLSQNGWCWEKGRVCSAQRASLTSVFHKDSAAAAKSLQSCRTLCNPIDGSSPGSPVPGILQARTLEWVAISFSNAWKWSRSVIWLLVTSRTAAHQAPPSMGFPRQEYWSGVPLPSPVKCMGILEKPGSCLRKNSVISYWPPGFGGDPYLGNALHLWVPYECYVECNFNT